jgi:hypothetical protein
MHKSAAVAGALVLLVLLSFFAGWYWRNHQLLNGPQFELTQTLTLSTGVAPDGSLPNGSRIYEFKQHPEITTYVVFINSKRRDAFQLKETQSNFLVKPIDAF